jgi:Protein of unknown function with HXXEE motif
MVSLLEALHSWLSLDLVIWAFPVAFLIHDLEEILTMERFGRKNHERFPKFMRNIAIIDTRQFTIAVVVLFVLTLVASYLATRSPRQMDFFTIVLAVFFVHAFGHIAFPLIFHQYTPGLITTVPVVLPYSLYAFHRLFSANLIDVESLKTSMLIGALVFIPLVLLVRQIGKLLSRRTHSKALP